MSHSLHNLKRPSSNKRGKKRVGRGNASGKGTFSGRGLKGQRSRSGGRQGLAKRSTFQQLLVRTPKLRGFKRQSPEIAIINLSTLNDSFKDGDMVNAKSLISKNLIRKTKGGFKVLGNGTIDKKIEIKANFFSDSAKKAIEKAGGKCEVVG
jgi:large subunit ribosomal protein L15|tara:strand:+ start:518 stop:970 length:453 start_codon:yes stop_codon:yes gene_type:complete